MILAKQGFTLIEVFLAVSILAFGIIGVLRAYAVSIDAIGNGQYTIDSVCLLREKMTEMEQAALEEGLSLGTSTGEFDGEFEGFKWELEVRPSSVEDLNEVILVISHKEKTRKFFLVTYAGKKENE